MPGRGRDLAHSTLHPRRAPVPVNAPVAHPIYQTAAWQFADLEQMDAIFGDAVADGATYGTIGLPNNLTLEAAISDIEGTEAAVAGNTGMAVIAASLLTELKPGDRVIVGKEGFGWTLGLLRDLRQWGIEHVAVDLSSLEDVTAELNHGAALLIVETVSNPRLRVPNLPALTDLAHRFGAKVLVDNTFATPYHCRPADYGADLVVESATKFLAGHADTVLGVVSGPAQSIERIRDRMIRLGSIAAPMDSWLVLRGLQTLVVRMARATQTAAVVADWLAQQPQVRRVLYPGRSDHPDHQTAMDLLDEGYGPMLSFELPPDFTVANQFTRDLETIRLVHSLGATQTTLSHPASSTHRLLSAEEMRIAGLHPGFLRMSVGLESPDDLIDDLHQALKNVPT
ncbi:aminotransferase class V-fold PLP-dependent enzyme [Streptomyces sparsogenes]|uniref:trans-sulfuration enzyme family protein n=1 Tax=Streptomyces sparsogenes TaxID=67365 RepID=UPI0033CAE23E